jgi:AcrR family transcriptional regulator
MDAPVTERRRRTEDRILAAAQALFAENGYEKTTVRAVAAAADIDPALVIRYFGSKQELFHRAARLPDAQPEAEPESPDTLAIQLTNSLGAKLGGLPPSTLALLRSMFTHPEAAARVRKAINEEIGRLGRAAPDTELQAGLAATMMLGVTIGRQMLALSSLTEASVTDIQRAMQPALRAVMAQD